MKDMYDYNDTGNELDAAFFLLAMFLGIVIGAGVVFLIML